MAPEGRSGSHRWPDLIRAIIVRAVAVVLAFGAALVVVEILLRVGGLVALGSVSTVTEAEFRRIPGIFAPGQSLIDRQLPALPYRVSINSLGYRGEEFPREKPPEEFRILFVGDSFVYGSYVDDQESLPAQLEGMLQNSCPGVRVINAGLGGSTIVSHRALVERGLTLEPDLVLLLFSENDVTDFAVEPMWHQLARNRARKSRFPLSVAYPFLRTTALWNLALRARGAARGRRTVLADDDAPARDAESGDDARALGAPFTEQSRTKLRPLYEREFLALRDTLRSEAIPLIFTAFPSHHTLSGTWPDEQLRWVHDMVKRFGVEDVDLYGPLARSGLGEDLFLLPYDGHPSVTGYRVAADALAERLLVHPAVTGACVTTFPETSALKSERGHRRDQFQLD